MFSQENVFHALAGKLLNVSETKSSNIRMFYSHKDHLSIIPSTPPSKKPLAVTSQTSNLYFIYQHICFVINVQMYW